MPERLRNLLTARVTVLALLVASVAVMTVAAVVPQVGLEADGGVGLSRQSSRWTELSASLGLDRVFSTRWFAALALLFVVSLALSALEQLRLARARTFLIPPEGSGQGATESTLSVGEVSAVLREEGYRRLSDAPGRSRYVRHWHGYWGAFLLHAGMVVTVLFSATYVLTEHRAKVRVASGGPTSLADAVIAAKRGLFARDVPLPAELSLYRVEPTFGANDQLVDVASEVVFRDGRGTPRDVRVAVNDYQDYQGVVVYQLVKFGNVFDLHARDEAGRGSEVRVRLAYPQKRDVPSYGTEPLGDGRTLKVKYWPRGDRSGMALADPELVVRLYDGERLLGEASLREGEEAQLGGTAVRLVRVGWWTELLFEGSLGTTGIFVGFGVLLAGGVLAFFVVPREVVVRAHPGGCTVVWRTARFADMYEDERARLLVRIGRQGS